MGRLKVKMEPINDTKKRRITFQKRKENIIKKATELSTLCDVDVAMIIYNDQRQTPQIFPPDIVKFNNVIHNYQKLRHTDPSKIKSHDLSKKKNLEGKYPTWFGFLNDYTEGSLREFASGLENKIDKVKARIEYIKKSQNLESYSAASNVIVLDDDDDDVVNLDPITDGYNSNVVNCDSMMSEEDYKNLGIDLDELFSDKDGLGISNVLMSEKEENDKFWFDDGNFSLESDPLPGFCFSPEIMQSQQYQQPESSSWCMEKKEFVMPSLPLHLMDYITERGYHC